LREHSLSIDNCRSREQQLDLSRVGVLEDGSCDEPTQPWTEANRGRIDKNKLHSSPPSRLLALTVSAVIEEDPHTRGWIRGRNRNHQPPD